MRTADSFYKILLALPDPALKGFMSWAVLDMAKQVNYPLVLDLSKLDHLPLTTYIEKLEKQFQAHVDTESLSDGVASLIAAQLADSRNLPNPIALIETLLLYVQFSCIATIEDEELANKVSAEMIARQYATLDKIARIYGVKD
ncbi:hypothetical protein [Nostoc sp. 106C]|uniref:hypothetical protein n=2 Tax=Nostoc sp. 106C TaxID=1932667 RepID=UPI000A3D306A|nr:hypothetical protein [Nostoc sp. 106C]OUL23703.1 hypothetical protein BV375_25355 [Nostoc sp. 106C]